MHSISEFGTNVPAFLAKLWKMVEDPTTNDLILWSPSGKSFLIRDQARFCKELLPMYYKHNNMASFIRQLNMYGFHKIVSVDAGSTKLEQDENEFHHPCFIRDHPYMLEHIKRKITGTKIEGVSGRSEMVNKVLTDVRQMRSRQETMDSRLSQMKLENEALWRELAILRQKHMKQQQIVNKLIQFLVSLVQHPHNNGITVKRRNMPLMLQDKAGRRSESSKSEQKMFVKSPSGPVIHELDAAEYATALLDTVEDVEALSNDQSDQFITIEPSVNEAESILQSVEPEMKSDENGVINEGDFCAEHFLVSPTPEDLSSDDTASALLLESPAQPQNVSGLKVLMPVSKRGRPKKKKPKKYVGESDNKQTTSDINSIILPEITGSGYDSGNSNLPILMDTVISKPEELNHITPEIFDTNIVDLEQTVDLEQLAEICPPVGLINNNQSAKGNKTDTASVLTKSQTGTTETKNNSNTVVTKTIPNKRYNIGKNASALFRSKKAKLSKKVEEENLNKQPSLLIKQEVLSPSNETEETISNNLPVCPAESSKTVAVSPSVPEQNSDMTVACTTGKGNKINRFSGNGENCISFKKVEDVDNHVDNMQTELDSLKELLKCETLSLDANALLGIVSSVLDDPLCNGNDQLYNNTDLPNVQASFEELKENDINSNKITMYSAPPAVFDLNDVFTGSDWSLPMACDSYTNVNDPGEDLFPEVNTPNVSLSQPPFSPPTKKRKK